MSGHLRLRLGVRLLVGLALLAATALAASPGPAELPLKKVAEFRLKHARHAAAAVVIDECVYVIGGGAPAAITTVEKFDTRTTELRALETTLIPRRFHQAFAHEGKVYLFGGQGYGLNEDVYEVLVEIYDPATGSVERGPAMKRPGAITAAAQIGSRVYFAGGAKKRGSVIGITNDLDIFDFATREWSTGPSMPTPRVSSGTAVGPYLLVAGGQRKTVGVTDVEMFVPEEKVWKALPPLGRPMRMHASVFLGEHLFLVSDQDDLDVVLAYNLRTRKSTAFRIPGFKGARYAAAVVCRDRVYVIGGNRQETTAEGSDLIQVFAVNPAYRAE